MIAVVIVAFDMHERLRQHLELLAGQSAKPDCVILVNNGKESVEWARKEFGRSFRMELMSFDNIGPAGGFREGAKRAYALGYDYVIFADDDAHPGPGALARFHALANAGIPAVAGYYTMGDAITTSNHYLMVGRKALSRAGFYFAPLFIMMEDTEFFERIKLAAGIVHDEKIVISHPCRPVQSFNRWRLTTRNIMICSSVWGYASFLRYSITMPLRFAFLSAFTGKAGFLHAYLSGVADFALGRHGRPDRPVRGIFEPKVVAGFRADSVDVAVVRTEGERKLFGAKGIDEGALRKTLGLGGMLDCAWTLAGKKVYLSSTFFFADMSAYMPCAILAREVYTDDLGTPAFAFKGGILKAAAFGLVFAPLAGLGAVLSVPFYFLRGATYRGMYRRQMDEDSEFCKKADDMLGARDSADSRRI